MGFTDVHPTITRSWPGCTDRDIAHSWLAFKELFDLEKIHLNIGYDAPIALAEKRGWRNSRLSASISDKNITRKMLESPYDFAIGWLAGIDLMADTSCVQPRNLSSYLAKVRRADEEEIVFDSQRVDEALTQLNNALLEEQKH